MEGLGRIAWRVGFWAEGRVTRGRALKFCRLMVKL